LFGRLVGKPAGRFFAGIGAAAVRRCFVLIASALRFADPRPAASVG